MVKSSWRKEGMKRCVCVIHPVVAAATAAPTAAAHACDSCVPSGSLNGQTQLDFLAPPVPLVPPAWVVPRAQRAPEACLVRREQQGPWALWERRDPQGPPGQRVPPGRAVRLAPPAVRA